MQIKVWSNFKKRTNSTLQPTGGTTINGYFRNSDVFSLYAPVIMFDLSALGLSATQAPPYNYCYIPDFSRYYWITDWTHNAGVWAASLSCDVLASFKADIGEEDVYVLRSSYEYNGSVDDSKYPTLAEKVSYVDNSGGVLCTQPGSSTAVIVPNLWNRKFIDGCYVINIYGPNQTGVTQYIATWNGFLNLAQELYNFDITSDGKWDWLNESLPEGYSKAIADPLQFIESVKWYPVTPYTISGSTTVKLGYYTIGSVQGIQILNTNQTVAYYTTSFDLRKHPQAATRGKYLRGGEYSQYKLFIPPFGDFDLESSKLIDSDKVQAEWYVDYASGAGKLFLYGTDAQGSTNSRVYLGNIDAQFAVEITINQNTINLDKVFSKTNLIAGGLGAIQGAASTLSTLTSEPSSGGSTTHVSSSGSIHGGAGRGFGGGGGSSWGTSQEVEYADMGGIRVPMPAGTTAAAKEELKENSTYSKMTKVLSDFASGFVGGFKKFNSGLQPHLSSVGGAANYLTYASGINAKIFSYFYLLADEDNASLGRPLLKIRKPKNIPGYIITDNPKIGTIGTREETDTIKQHMVGGFFYE